MTVFILLAVTYIKFHEGGWITILVTGTLVAIVTMIRRHYDHTARLMRRLDKLVITATTDTTALPAESQIQEFNPDAKTASFTR